MKITGELLKSERTRKNLTVQDIAFALKLSQKIITSIEAGQTESLPAKTFIRGFVKSYAQFLKMDSEQVMRQFQEEMGSTNPSTKNATVNSAAVENYVRSPDGQDSKKSSPEQSKVLNQSKSNLSLFYIGIAVALVILIVAVNRIVDRYQKEGVVNPQDLSKVQPLDPNQTHAASSTPAVIAGAVSSVQMAHSADTTSASPTTTPPTSAVASIPTSTPATAARADSDDGFEPSSGKPVEIIIEAKKDTEIMYARGNTKTFSKLKLVSKQVQVIRSTTGLHLKSEDGGAFHMVVNGIDKGQAGSNNKPVRLSF